MTALSEIAYVNAQVEDCKDGESRAVQVKGSHSTKVQAVVQRLLLIKEQDPHAKCLVFSTVSFYFLSGLIQLNGQ